MPLAGPLLSQEIEAALAPWNGVQLKTFSLALGGGIVLALTGKLQFQTMDVGTGAGVGAGMGMGVSGLQNAQMSGLMYDKGQGWWSAHQKDGPGVEWKIFCDKISLAVKNHLAKNAQLISNHGPVALGVGKVQRYFGVTPVEMTAAIVGLAPQWAAARFPELADAVATGVMGGILQHSPKDQVQIVGAPAGIPVPAAGAGIGKVI